MKTISLFIVIGLLLSAADILPRDEPAAELSLEQILSRAHSVGEANDSLLSITKYRFEQSSVFNRLEKDGSIKKADTTIAIITRQGDEELSREVVYSSTGEGESKKSEGEKQEISLSPDNPDYNFSLTGITGDSYKISVSPKASPPKEGQYVGIIEIDSQDFYVRSFDFVVPDPEGALKEFAIAINFEPLEGGLFVPAEMRMTGFVKAVLGIIKVRFSGEFKFSDYEILE
ncbi:MAG: hypothetical protein JSW64_04645 [Candidatus Zixiibacteriota bacterium]|nr:MAG: hypothetical protein JSW64_04645 [candidate division Zixibacteria bacterium]